MASDGGSTAEPRLYRRRWPRRLPLPYRAAHDERIPLPADAYLVPAAAPTYKQHRVVPLLLAFNQLFLAGTNVFFGLLERSSGRQEQFVQRMVAAAAGLALSMAFLAWSAWQRRRNRDGRPPFGLVLFADGLVDFSPMRKTVIPREAIERLNFFERSGSAYVRINARAEKPRNRFCDYGPYYANAADLEHRVVRWYDAHAADVPD